MNMRAILAAALCGIAISAAPAIAGLSYDFGPHVGPNHPGPDSRWSYKPNGGPSVELPGGRRMTDRCMFLRGEYRLRHPADKPSGLRAFRGCQLWKLDHDYHSRIDNLERTIQLSGSPTKIGRAWADYIIILVLNPVL